MDYYYKKEHFQFFDMTNGTEYFGYEGDYVGRTLTKLSKTKKMKALKELEKKYLENKNKLRGKIPKTTYEIPKTHYRGYNITYREEYGKEYDNVKRNSTRKSHTT